MRSRRRQLLRRQPLRRQPLRRQPLRHYLTVPRGVRVQW
jgi:hypothetical protein